MTASRSGYAPNTIQDLNIPFLLIHDGVKVWDAKKLVWVEFDDGVDSNTNHSIATRFKNVRWRPESDRDGRITDMWRSWRVNLSVVGVFRKSKDPNFGFGHTNAYPFMIVVSKIERVGRLKKL